MVLVPDGAMIGPRGHEQHKSTTEAVGTVGCHIDIRRRTLEKKAVAMAASMLRCAAAHNGNHKGRTVAGMTETRLM